MILRIWCGLVPTERAADYADLVRRTGVAGYREVRGNLDAQVATRHLSDGRSEIMALSWWNDLDDIRAFAGADVESAKFYPEDDRFLLGRDLRVRHFVIVR